MLKNYDYPGNVRELRNIIEDAFVFSSTDVINPADLRFNQYRKFRYYQNEKTLSKGGNGKLFRLSHPNAVQEFERQYFIQALEKYRWQVTDTAKAIGISREWLSKKMKVLGLKKP